MRNQKFIIQPHFRLQEWVAEEKGYFKDEGLDYEFRKRCSRPTARRTTRATRSARMQTFEKGRNSDVSCACHWTVNVAADQAATASSTPTLYSVAPSRHLRAGGFAGQDAGGSGRRADLGRLSSRAATTRPSRRSSNTCRRDKINLSFNDGMLFSRMELLLDGKMPACTLFSGPYYFAEQLGFRKIIDTTFMIATMITGNPDPEDVRKFFRALRRAQRDIDLRPELYTHYYRNEIPEALPRRDGHAPLGTGRAHRVRAIFARGVRGVAQVDRRARHLRRHRSRRGGRTTSAVVTLGGVSLLSRPLARMRGESVAPRQLASRVEGLRLPQSRAPARPPFFAGATTSRAATRAAQVTRRGLTPTTPCSRSPRPSPAPRTSPTRCWGGSRPRRRTSQSRSRCRR